MADNSAGLRVRLGHPCPGWAQFGHEDHRGELVSVQPANVKVGNEIFSIQTTPMIWTPQGNPVWKVPLLQVVSAYCVLTAVPVTHAQVHALPDITSPAKSRALTCPVHQPFLPGAAGTGQTHWHGQQPSVPLWSAAPHSIPTASCTASG